MKTKTQNQTCPECGMVKSQWTGHQGQGIEQNGKLYCCEGCAEGTGCICDDQADMSARESGGEF